MKNRTSGYNSDNEQSSTTTKTATTTTTAKQLQQDLSILRKPILTSLIGFLEAKRTYDNGTEEIRRLLSQECDILYECKVCRNLFRSLINFISHKRVYCHDCYSNGYDINRNGFIDQDVTTIIQTEEKYIQKCHQSNNHKSTNKKHHISSSTVYNNNNNNNSNQQTSNNNNNNSNNNNNNNLEKPNKDLTSIIERLTNREQKNRILKLADYYEQISLKLTQDEVIKKNHIIQLDGIQNSNAAVYQTVKNEDCDNIKKELLEVNEMLNCNNILGPDGKLININNFSGNNFKINNNNHNNNNNNHNNNNTENDNDNDDDNNIESTINSTINDIKIANGIENNLIEKNLVCKICKMKFSTEKTLKLHIQTKHIPSTYVYQCPSCSQTFLQASAVSRHLSNDHKKSLRRIRQMRETIFKKRMRIDEVQIKGPSRELARLQVNQADDAEKTRAWMDNIERSPKNSPLCTYCGKKFERRAVLTTHLQNCSAKNRQTPTPIINKKLTDLTTFSRETSASRSSTSSPANNNSVSTVNGTNGSNPNTNTSSLLEFAAKSIANAFEPIKAEEKTKTIDYSPSNEIFEIIKPKSDNCLNQKINKRKRRKPETIIIRKAEISNVNSVQETPKMETTNQNESEMQVDRNELTEKKVEKLKLTKLSLKNVIKKPKLIIANPIEIIKEVPENEDGEEKDAPIPTTIEDDVTPIKIPDKALNAACGIFKKKDFNRDKFLKLVTPRKDLIFYCRICKKAFGALSNLRRHISMFHYRRRKFGCHICPYRAFRKYDVVNHLNSAHSLSGEQNLDQILVAEDNYGKDAVDGDIIISDNGEIKGEKEEDIENIKADIAKANNTVKNKMQLNKTENYIIKNVSNKKGRKPKEPYVVKNIPIQNTDDIINLDLEIVPNIDESANVEKINLELPTSSNDTSLVTVQDDKTNDTATTSNDLEIICDEKILNKNNSEHEEIIVEQKIPGNIKRSDSILSISSNEDRLNSTTTSTNSSVTNGPTLKRPIRNRVKPVNKDFVYDLSNFLKKDMLCTERDAFSFGNKAAAKRRNTIVNLDDSSRESNSSNSTISSNSSYNLHIISSNNQNSKDDEKVKQLSKSTSTQSTPMVFSHNSVLEKNNNGNITSRSTGTSTSNTKSIILSPKLIAPQYNKESNNTVSTPSSPTGIISQNKVLNGIDKVPTLNSSTHAGSNHHLFKSFEDLKKIKHVRRTSDDAIIRYYNKKRKSIDISEINSSMSDTSIQSTIDNTKSSSINNNVNDISKIDKNINGSATNNVQTEVKKSSENNNTIHKIGSAEKILKNDLASVVEINKNVPIKDNIRPILLANKKIGTEPPSLQHNKTEEKFTIKCPSEKDFEEYLLKNNLAEPVKKINISAIIEQEQNANATKNLDSSNQQNALLVSGKRISLLQRLTENKNKKLQKESLLRNALEN